MIWESTKVLTSAIAPEVRVTCRRFSQRLKAKLELELAPYRSEVREKMLTYAEDCIIDDGLRDNDGNLVLGDDERPVHVGDSEFIRAQKRTRQTAFNAWLQGQIEARLKPATLRAYVKSVEGLTVDGKPVTDADGLLDGPEEIAEEVYRFILESGALSESERKNSPSPTTSPEAEGGPMSLTTAVPA